VVTANCNTPIVSICPIGMMYSVSIDSGISARLTDSNDDSIKNMVWTPDISTLVYQFFEHKWCAMFNDEIADVFRIFSMSTLIENVTKTMIFDHSIGYDY
jgi:hypothetical protein